MAGMMQMIVPLIPQIVQLAAPSINLTRQRPSREQVGIGEAREQTMDPRGVLMGLKPSRFFWSLIEKSPSIIPEMLQRTNQYIAAEALVAGKRMDGKRPRAEQSQGTTLAAQVQPRRRPDRQELLLPRFHRDYGHDTEDYRDLQNQIKDLIQRGHLGRYLKEPQEVTQCPRGPVERKIDVISGGPVAGGSSSTARKAYAQSVVEKCPRPKLEPEITFGAKEVERSHHDDALVISSQIANARVKRVMVDTGSFADVLYLDAFKKFSLTKEDLTPMASALTGFTGDSISPLGTTILLVTIGEEPRAKMIMTTFMIVDLPSTYNVILG
ncbi:uncharacterized protein LOC135611524 [Musa acuminata AAA Group]|uniref:uncharacterized protein LOC135611524 n=1 Tax=Musa acuminata AAA Group TaxID=214697 RepID=UPI0031D2894D